MEIKVKISKIWILTSCKKTKDDKSSFFLSFSFSRRDRDNKYLPWKITCLSHVKLLWMTNSPFNYEIGIISYYHQWFPFSYLNKGNKVVHLRKNTEFFIHFFFFLSINNTYFVLLNFYITFLLPFFPYFFTIQKKRNKVFPQPTQCLCEDRNQKSLLISYKLLSFPTFITS